MPMTTTEKTLVELMQELPPALREEVRQFAEFLLARQRRELARQAEANGWPEGYVESTAGSIPDFPDRDMHGIDESLDEAVDELRFDLPEQPLS
jgi:hypothetical protein